MKPSRELDAKVAKHIMGYECVCDEIPIDCPIHAHNDRDTLRPYSTDVAAAWRVIIKMRELGFGFTISDNANRHAGHIDCRFWRLNDDMRRGIAIEDKAPIAICLAALKAAGVEVESGTE